MSYTTHDLIDILEKELQATCQGQRVLLSSADRLGHPVIAKALDLTKVGKVFAYQDFRSQVHDYQRQYRVSGIVWRDCFFNGDRLSLPELHRSLIAIPGDKEILLSAKKSILNFWRKHTRTMKFWLNGHPHQPLTAAHVQPYIQETEWADLESTQTELILALGWGNPQEYQYQWAYPDSGCYRIIASFQDPSAIKL